jgi:3-oxoacyl-[acyl-carrier protein] reductase
VVADKLIFHIFTMKNNYVILIENNLAFNNKNIFIGGSTNGIGWESAKLFAKYGGNLTLVARNENLLLQRLQELPNNGNQHHQYIVADFSDPENLETILNEFVVKNPVKYDVLINNTGGPPSGQLEKASTEELLSAFNLHLISFHKILGCLLQGMKSREAGSIINIISTSVKQPLNGLGVSNTIRGAVANWAKTLANELGGYNITVNNVLPGATNTGRLKEIIKNKAQKLNLQESAIEKQMADQVPLKRIAEPIEVANAVVFLASDNARYISGINLPVDGGRTKSL